MAHLNPRTLGSSDPFIIITLEEMNLEYVSIHFIWPNSLLSPPYSPVIVYCTANPKEPHKR